MILKSLIIEKLIRIWKSIIISPSRNRLTINILELIFLWVFLISGFLFCILKLLIKRPCLLLNLILLGNPLIIAQVVIILFYFDSQLVERWGFFIICVTVHPYLFNVPVKLTRCLVLAIFKIGLHCWKVHRLLNNVQVIIGSVKFWIDWKQEWISAFVFF